MEITSFVVSGRDKAKLYGDYGTYRTQLSNRIHNLRRKLGVATKARAKYTTKTPITAEDIARSHEFVNLLLLTSERAWAHAMSMRDAHSADKSGITGPARSHIISRLHKAVLSSSHLFNLLSDRSTTSATSEDVLEARAYAAALTGAMNFEKQAWEPCVKTYAEARIIYSSLAASSKKEVFRQVLEETVDPSIRYAAYQLRMPRTVAIPTIARRFFPSDKALSDQVQELDPDVLNEQPAKARTEVADTGSEAAPKTITWRSRTVDLEDATIASALAAAKTAEKKLVETLKTLSGEQAREKAAAYDDILIASQDAVDATKHAIDELVSEGVGQGDKRIQSLQITRTAVSYEMVSWRIGRNRVLVGEADGASISSPAAQKSKKGQKAPREEGTGRKLAHLREKVVLYDAIIQSLDSVKELPGVAADEKFLSDLDQKYGYFNALKALALARSHALLSNPKNSLALLALAVQKTPTPPSNSPSDITSPDTPPNIVITPTQLSTLHSLLHAEVNRFRGLVELANLTEALEKKQHDGGDRRPLVERLHEYGVVDTANLVVYPPKVEVAPVKPLFFDAAWNYIDYDRVQGVEKKVEQKQPKQQQQQKPKAEEKDVPSDAASQQEQPQKRGWFGFGR